MTAPFYVAPEQVMKDRADYARKGIARGRSLVAVSNGGGILLVADNPSRLLRKTSEIYDRIGFAGVGKYNEFDQLRIAGVRHADLKGFSYSREDVDARSLANQYAQILGNIFTHEMKPLEVEILVAEVGAVPVDDCLFHIQYDGTLIDEDRFTVLGGDADTVRTALAELMGEAEPADLDIESAFAAAVRALSGPERRLDSDGLEVALLDRSERRRRFRRLTAADFGPWLEQTWADAGPADDASADASPDDTAAADPDDAAAPNDSAEGSPGADDGTTRS